MFSDSKSFRSVGIDIGSTTTHLAFSKITLGYIEEKHKFEVVGREVTYLSEISLTPYAESYNIDIESLSSILSAAYEDAGYSPEEIDTGAIIMTGEAVKKHNAEKIINLFAGQMGKFVCATAGPNYEAVLAAYGSGAVEQSERIRITIMNVDVGGGTSKVAIVKKGEIVDTACISVGARPVVMDDSGRVVQIEETAEILSKKKNIRIRLGEILPEDDQRKIATTLANSLYEVMKRGRLSALTEQLMVTPPLSYKGKVDMITFSGGVAEYIYGYTDQEFGDLGRFLGEEIRRISGNLCIPISEPAERIRATVIGVSHYTLQVSGNTTFVSSPGLLPLRNLPVVSPNFASNVLSEEDMEREIRKGLEMHDITEEEGEFALAFRRSVINHPSYGLMKALASAVLSALENRMKNGKTVVLVFEADIGMGMGRVIKEELDPECKLVSIDEIRLQDFNYIDIGEPTVEGFIPVMIKSLIFPARSST